MLCETETFQLVDGLTAPLDQRSDAVVLQVLLQLAASFCLNLVVLVDVVVIRIAVRRGWEDQFGNIATPVRAPDYTVSLNATYDFHLGSVTVSPTLGWNYSDAYAIGTTGSPQSTNGTWSGSQGYINAQLAFAFENLPGLSVAVDCRNCADKAYPMSALGPFQFLDRPGSWGARVRYKF